MCVRMRVHPSFCSISLYIPFRYRFVSVAGLLLIALSANDISGISGYLNLAITGLSLIPSSIICTLVMERLGRRPVGVMAALTFSVGLLVRVILAIFVPNGKTL